MRVKNTTDFSRETIAEIIRFARPPGIGNFQVTITNTARHCASGWATGGRVMVRLPRGDCRYKTWKRGAYLGFWVGSRTEALVQIMAHELRHVWQSKHPRGWRVWGARGKYSERDADAYALHKLREWRRR